MLQRALPVPLGVEFRKVRQAVLYGSANYSFRHYEAVGLCQYATVDAAWSLLCRGAMVFGCLGYGFYLLRVEPFGKTGIAAYDAAGFKVVRFASGHKACVVKCSRCIYHVFVNRIMLCQMKAALDHAAGMVLAMSGVEGSITRNHLLFAVILKGGVYHIIPGLEPLGRFELPTCALRMRCSTAELKWHWVCKDSNNFIFCVPIMKALVFLLGVILGAFPLKTTCNLGGGDKQVFVIHYKWGLLNADVFRVSCTCDSTTWHGEPAYKARIYGKTEKFCESIIKVREDFQGSFLASDMRPVKSSRKATEPKFNGGESYKYDWDAGKLEMTINGKNGTRNKSFDIAPGLLDVPSIYYAVRRMDLSKVKRGKAIKLDVAVGDKIEQISFIYDGREMLQARGVDKVMANKLRISVSSGNTFDNKNDIVLWLSDDEFLVPLYFEAPMRLGKVVGRLETSTGKKSKK